MSSRGGGPRSKGTDGSDHQFRQTVDNKYKKAAAARKHLRKSLAMLLAYYPAMTAFAVGPALATGVTLDAHNAPFAAAATLGFVLALISRAGWREEAQPRALRRGHQGASLAQPPTLRRAFPPPRAHPPPLASQLMSLVGIANLVGAIGVRFVAHEDRRMAWVASEFIASRAESLSPGQAYPVLFSVELLLEIVGVVVPLGVVAVGHALVKYTSTAKSN